MAAQESKLRLLIMVCLVCGTISLGSIGVVRYANRQRAVTPGIVMAAQRLTTLPDSLVQTQIPLESFRQRRDQFILEITSGSLPVESIKAFYQSYALWMSDGVWDTTDVGELGAYLNLQPSKP